MQTTQLPKIEWRPYHDIYYERHRHTIHGNILIGSFGKISFNDFLSNLTPGVILAFVGLVIYSGLIYRKDLETSHKPSDLLREKLAESSQITQPDNLKKVGWVGLGMLLMFVFGERIHLIVVRVVPPGEVQALGHERVDP